MPASAALPAERRRYQQARFRLPDQSDRLGRQRHPGRNIAHAEAQLAGVLTDASGKPYANAATPGTGPGGTYTIPVVNFSYDTAAEEGCLRLPTATRIRPSRGDRNRQQQHGR